MVTITCKISAELNDQLEAEASRKMLPKSALVREALERSFKRPRRRQQTAFDSVEGSLRDHQGRAGRYVHQLKVHGRLREVTVLIIDTSFLVAFLQERDAFHSWAVAVLKSHSGRLATCEAVLAETTYFLRDRLDARTRLLNAVAAGNIGIPFALASEAAAIEKLMDRYRNVPMSLADACLVRMAEIQNEALVLTLDQDFRIYRKSNRQVISTLMPSR